MLIELDLFPVKFPNKEPGTLLEGAGGRFKGPAAFARGRHCWAWARHLGDEFRVCDMLSSWILCLQAKRKGLTEFQSSLPILGQEGPPMKSYPFCHDAQNPRTEISLSKSFYDRSKVHGVCIVITMYSRICTWIFTDILRHLLPFLHFYQHSSNDDNPRHALSCLA